MVTRIITALAVLCALILLKDVINPGPPYVKALMFGLIFLLVSVQAMVSGKVGSSMRVSARSDGTPWFYVTVTCYLAFAIYMLRDAYKIWAGH